MKTRLVASLGALLTSTGMVLAQAASAPPAGGTSAVPPASAAVPQSLPLTAPPVLPSPPVVPPPVGDVSSTHGLPPAKDAPAPGCRVWGSAEYLCWWVKSAPLPVQLATIGDVAAAAAAGLPLGALGTPGTVVASPNQQNFGPLSGGRVSLGWVDCENNLGLEGNAFLMQTRTNSFAVQSGANGGPAISVPFFDPVASADTAVNLTSPGSGQGGVVASSTLQLWGAEANGTLAFFRGDWLNMDLIGGFRYIDLSERLEIGDVLGANNPSVPIIAGMPTPLTLPTGAYVLFRDHIATRNQYYAGQFGARAEAHHGHFFINVSAKLALGSDQEVITYNGNTTVVPPTGAQPVIGGGIFTQGTNIGRFTRNQFSVAPEGKIGGGIDFTRHIRLFAAYEFLYLDKVVRPGRQLDPQVDLSQAPFFVGGAAAAATSTNPAQMFNTSHFWAQGISAGLQLSF